jgi:glycosyltransferase involved in cell wall biosynthesis
MGSLKELGQNGENGVYLVGAVPVKTLAKDLLATQVMAYPCDPTRFTEGFSVAVLDACAAGCVPVVAGVDALTEVHGSGAYIIPGSPSGQYGEWIDTIVAAMTDEGFADGVRHTARTHAANFSRQKVAALWETLIRERKK